MRYQTFATLTAAEVEDIIMEVGERAPRQAQLALATVKQVLHDARRRGHRVDDGILEIKPPRSRERRPRFLTWEEVEHLASWMDDANGRLVQVAALTGLRQSELFGLRWEDVDLPGRTLTVQGGKTDAARRTVNLPVRAVELLREQAYFLSQETGEIRKLGAQFLGNGKQSGALSESGDAGEVSASGRCDSRGNLVTSRGPNPSSESALSPSPGRSLVFPTPSGTELRPDNWMHRVFRPAREKAGFGVTFHDLRHTFISLSAAAGVHASVVARQVGHADGGALLLRRYRHLFPEETRHATELLDVLIERTRERKVEV